MNITSLILEADIVVKSVLLILMFFSVVSWAVFLSKQIYFKRTVKDSEDFYKKFIKDKDMDRSYLDAKYFAEGFIPNLYIAGYKELKILCDNILEKESIDNIQRAMIIKRDEIIESLSDKINFLATIGSSAPFIGLFGTVWGIMNSFRGLASQQSASLSAVAPGIAEALIATAVGLFAAIPAVLFYNSLNKKIQKVEQRSDGFVYEFINITYRIFLQPEQKKPEVESLYARVKKEQATKNV